MKDGKIELCGKDKMKNLVTEIQNILLETNPNTSAGKSLARLNGAIEGRVEEENLAAPKNNKGSSNSDVEEDDDIITKSKEDLENKDDKSAEKSSKKVATPDESPSTINLSDAASFEKLVDILNQFRAAHSFTDEEVSSRLKDYFESLEREEKEVLHVLIKGLVQITVLDVSGKDAYTPSKLMFKISKTGSASSERKKSIERKIDNQDDVSNVKDSKNSAGSLPITTIGAGVVESMHSKKELIDIVRRNNI